ncbi:MAG: hypothetical protein IJ087_18805 [Eggerthellaceae bacterium]|nr:hypothetical protein [Eggerthellaceae bacterium]
MRRVWRYITAFAISLIASAVVVAPAWAVSVEQLGANYQVAVQAYEAAVVERAQNADEIAGIEENIARIDEVLERSRGNLADTAVALYKESRGHDALIEIVFASSSFTEAVERLDLYAKVQKRYAEQAHEFAEQQDRLLVRRAELEARKLEIESRVTEAKQAADDAEVALKKAMHTDGEKYHQVQGNNATCGATSFTVGVNILLGEERFTDNVEVWKGAGFQGDSTAALGLRGRAWLLANGLSDQIGIEELATDIRTTDALREQLEAGNLVIISSGSGSTWQRADGTTAAKGSFPDGHWIIFYRYEDGYFFANDSSVVAAQGAGVAYDEDEMQQWLDGRGNHFATIMWAK